MLTQRDSDIAVMEAKLKADQLFEEWRKSYLGKRAEVQDGSGQGSRGRGSPEGGEAPATDNYAPEE
jgi:hypothetical protein